MPSASALRIQIEHALERRFPAALSPVPRTIRETAATGIAEVDRLLGGGLPVGAISEITGPISSGRTSLSLAFLAARTQEDRVCAWVDAHDAFDSESAAANGVALRQLLWVRCQRRSPGLATQRQVSGDGALNPRQNARPLARPNTSRLDYAHLDQALRATDLLLQAGGFAAIVLDLGSTAPEQAARIPLATWFRFRQAADRTRCSLLVLAQQPLAQSSAAVVLECTPLAMQSRDQTVLGGCTYQVRTGRQVRTGYESSHPSSPFIVSQRKPPASTWTANAAWQREARA
jgi:recombination protein RecA